MSPLSYVEWDIRIGGAAVRTRRRDTVLSLHGCRRGEEGGSSPYEPAQAGQDRPWQAALPALERQLGQRRERRALARVVLSDILVRYAVVPWNPALANRDEEQAFLQHRFGQLYDARTAEWDIRVDRPHGERARLASAVEPALIEALGQLLRAHGIRLRSVVPALADTVARRLPCLKAAAGWLLVHDAGSLGMARWEDGAWMCARSVRVGRQWHAALPALLAREECLHDGRREARTVYIEDDAGSGGLPAVPGWEIRALADPDERARAA